MENMKRLKNIAKTLVLFSIALGFFACDDDDGNSVPFEIIGDVYVVKKTINDEVLFANTYIAYGNQPMSLAQVTTPGGEEIVLSPTSGYNNTYAQSPAIDEFTDQVEEGNYMFDVINEDIPHQDIDLLVFDNIDFTTITTLEPDVDILTLEWEENEMAEAYLVRLLDESGTVLFMSQLLGTQVSRFVINPGDPNGTWNGTPAAGTDYIVELQAFLFEQDATNNDYTFHIQEMSITDDVVTWQ